MQLNIKNPRTVELALELAKRTSDTVTGAVTKALERELERARPVPRFTAEEREAAIAEVLAIGKQTRQWFEQRGIPIPTQEEMDTEMYDADGLPR
ncbi:MAG: type II toxin-antitoxin system VapB family antitoxin [Sphingomonadaceae bacterium]|nr:type II toxin-antitoxin system VapB family antitoxin [Sphingomonadaceae bacterium]